MKDWKYLTRRQTDALQCLLIAVRHWHAHVATQPPNLKIYAARREWRERARQLKGAVTVALHACNRLIPEDPRDAVLSQISGLTRPNCESDFVTSDPHVVGDFKMVCDRYEEELKDASRMIEAHKVMLMTVSKERDELIARSVQATACINALQQTLVNDRIAHDERERGKTLQARACDEVRMLEQENANLSQKISNQAREIAKLTRKEKTYENKLAEAREATRAFANKMLGPVIGGNSGGY